jgi:hypothetical protein
MGEYAVFMTLKHIAVPLTRKQTGSKAFFTRVWFMFPDMSTEPRTFIFNGQGVIPRELFHP